ncbi:hypothetical protein ACFQY0_21215, partial [Haloferula chungangensis]
HSSAAHRMMITPVSKAPEARKPRQARPISDSVCCHTLKTQRLYIPRERRSAADPTTMAASAIHWRPPTTRNAT